VDVITSSQSSRPPAIWAFVTLSEDPQQSNDLRSLVIREDNAIYTISEVTGNLGKTLPEYMIPKIFIPLRKSFQTTSGKLDRTKYRELAALLETESLSDFSIGGKGEFLAPSTEMEKTMQRLWADVLGMNPQEVGANDNFLRLGGDSISAIKLVSCARREGILLSVANIFNDPRLAQVSAAASSLSQESIKTVSPSQLIPENLLHTTGGGSNSDVALVRATTFNMQVHSMLQHGPKPAILCLHGGGSSAAIFQIQTLMMRKLLSPLFDFVFIDAPFVADPGLNVLPFFADLGPYYTWVDLSKEAKDPLEETWKLLENAILQQVARSGQSFAGVLGFSFGAGIAAELLLKQQERIHGIETINNIPPYIFEFGVFLMGVHTHMLASLVSDEKAQKISIPSIHVIGGLDPVRESSEALLAKVFDAKTSRRMEFAVDHRLPVTNDDNVSLASEILDLHIKKFQNFDGCCS
jgi:pimeloyl-ACP methyl ester carboxylesterase/aryl carrier-like protein